MYGAGQSAEVFAIGRRVPVPLHTVLPCPVAFLPYRRVAPTATRFLEQKFVNVLRDGNITYLWPSASLATHKLLHGRGVPVVMEGIIASPMGAGRIGDTPGGLLIADPAQSDALLEAMTVLATSADLRASLGQGARKRAAGFYWADVGARRGQMLLDRC